MTRPGVKPGAPEPHPQISPGSESREKLRSQMGFSLFYFCTLQPLSLSLTIKHNLWATLWWPKERKQQEQKLKGEKGRTISNSLAGSILPHPCTEVTLPPGALVSAHSLASFDSCGSQSGACGLPTRPSLCHLPPACPSPALRVRPASPSDSGVPSCLQLPPHKSWHVWSCLGGPG